MDGSFRKKLCKNGQLFKMSLEGIIAKYSKLQDQDGGIEVDLNNTTAKTLEQYYMQSQKKLDQLQSVSPADSTDELTETSQDISTDSQLDVSHCEKRDQEMSTHQLSDQDNALSKSESSEMTWSLSDESQRNISAIELQLQDEDTKQGMSLRSQGSHLGDLYPNMISQLERAWHCQHVSEAANSVLKRYRKWRHPANKSNQSISNTILRKTSSKANRKTQINKTTKSPLKKHFLVHKGVEAAPMSPLRIGNYVKDCQVQHQLRRKGDGFQRRQPHPPVLVMDLSSCNYEETLGRAFTVSHQSPQRSQPSICTVSPSKAQDIFFRSKGSSFSPLVKQTTGCSIHTLEASKEKADVYGSPVRQSPFKVRLMRRGSLGGIPHAFSVSPKSYSPSCSRELKRLRSPSTSLGSPPQTSTVPRKMLHCQDSRTIVQSQVHPPPSPSSVGKKRLRRHLSFESSTQPSNHVSYSAKQLDDDFIRLYHKFVCQSKYPFLGHPPCRACGRSSEVSRGHSSSTLAALALSPHRSLLRKRHREVMLDDHLQSKPSKEHYTNSPGSRR